MKILAAEIRNLTEFDNLPTLEVLVDKIPDYDSLVYEQKGNSYFAEKDGCVDFFYYNSPGEGYGGRKFTINVNGEQKDLIGPWSSNSEAMFQAGFQRTVSVSLTDDPKVMEKGHTFYAAHITLEKFVEACNIARCLLGQDKYGFINPMPSCEDCGNPLTQKYRVDLPKTKEKPYGYMIRKILCQNCANNYNLNCNSISSKVSYQITNEKRSVNSECSSEQKSILG